MVEQKQDICINRYNARHFEKLGYIIKRDKDLINCLILMKMHMKNLVTLKEELWKAMEEES